MSSTPGDFDLPGIADQAELEILTVETIEASEVSVAAAAEFGYYEAELSSLREAALTLNEQGGPPD